MRPILLRSLAVIGVGGVILGVVLYVASTVDTRPPEVERINLTQALAGDPRRAAITTSIEVVFSEPVEPDAAAAVVLDPAVDGAYSWSGRTLIFTPHDPLELEARYAVRIDAGIRDLAGNVMADAPEPFAFETTGRPAVVDTVPADGADEVPLDAPIALTFSTLMDTASVEANLRLRPAFAHELRWSGEVLEIVPIDPLRAGLDYEVSLQAEASDVAGVSIGSALSMSFRTIAPGLAAETLVPADGIDGIAPSSAIAVIFDRPIDPASVTDERLSITPALAGTLVVEALPDDPPSEDGAGSVLAFHPSGPMPPNTTYRVALAVGVASVTGGGLSEPIEWSFTTGAPAGAISNQITFIADRAGIPNVWTMNPDGTGQRQVSAELTPVLDYAIAPDGSSLVVTDGRRLVFSRADGTNRRVLTQEGVIEFDPTYAPSGRSVAFARADAESGQGLGLWEWEVGGGDPDPLEMPLEPESRPSPSASGSRPAAMRHPRYSPDGLSLAFVDLDATAIGVLDLSAEAVRRTGFEASSAPIWLPDSSGLLLNGARPDGDGSPTRFSAPVGPLPPVDESAVYRLARSGTTAIPTTFGPGARAVTVAPDGTIAYLDARDDLWLAATPGGGAASDVASGDVADAAFAPGEPTMVLIVDAAEETGRVELLDLDTEARTPLVPEGWRPRWLP